MNKGFEKKYWFTRFIECLLADEQDSEIAARVQREGVDLRRLFTWLRLYVNVESRSIVPERKKRAKNDLAIVNRGVREFGLPPEVGNWFRNRVELAHSTNGFSRVHNTDALAAAHLYLELCTRRPVTMRELAVFIEATNYALRQKPTTVDSQSVAKELQRYRKSPRNAEFLKILKEDIARNLSRKSTNLH